MKFTVKALSVAALFSGFNAALALPPAPKAEEMAAIQPKQPGVEVTVLAPADIAKCRVEAYPNAQAPAGYVLLDSSNRPVRRFVSVNSPSFNILSFYSDGEEVYRETDITGKGKVDQFRWLGSNGSKIGRDTDGNGTVDIWETITPEEVSKELFDAVVAKDANRLKALMPTDAELKSLGLPPGEIAKLQARMGNAVTRLNNTAAAVALTDKAKWIHVEFFIPETTAADAFGGSQDIVRHRNGGVLFDKGDGKNADFFQTGELVKLGNAWRVIDGPAPGSAQPPQKDPQGAAPQEIVPQEIKNLVAQLTEIKHPGPGAGEVKYHTDRAAILEKIVPILNGKPAQETWMRQLLDAHGSAAELGDKPSAERLAAWTGQIQKHAPKTPLAGFATLRNLGVEFSIKIKDANTQPKMADAQKWWRDSLEQFVKDYPSIDETPEALFRLAMAHEFNGKDGEATAIGHFTALAKNFPQHPLANQSAGAAKRLASVGTPFNLPPVTEVATGKAFDASKLAGKAVIVYYWGSFAAASGTLKADAAAFDALLKKHAGKLEVITITLDVNTQKAVEAINAAQLPGTHLTSQNGAAAAAWGVMGQHIFLVDKTGKVDNKNASVAQMGDDIERLVK